MRRSRFIAAVLILGILCIVAAVTALTQDQAAPAEPIIEAPEIPQPQPEAGPTTDGDPVLDLFNPSEATLNGQLSETSLKNRLEELVVLTFVLRRCMYLSEQEYAETFQAVGLYAHRMQPDHSRTIVDAAIASASASYGLLYARSSCDDAQLPATAAQLAQWRAAILNPPQQ